MRHRFGLYGWLAALGMGCQALSGLSGIEPGQSGAGGATTSVGGADVASNASVGGAMNSSVGSGGGFVNEGPPLSPRASGVVRCNGLTAACAVTGVVVDADTINPSIYMGGFFTGELETGTGIQTFPGSVAAFLFGGLIDSGGPPALIAHLLPQGATSRVVPSGIAQLPSGELVMVGSFTGSFQVNGDTSDTYQSGGPWSVFAFVIDPENTSTHTVLVLPGDADNIAYGVAADPEDDWFTIVGAHGANFDLTGNAADGAGGAGGATAGPPAPMLNPSGTEPQRVHRNLRLGRRI